MTQKLKWIVPSAIVGVAVLVWGVLQYLGAQAETRLRDALAEYGLQHRVHWQDISASMGGVTLKGVRIDLDEDSGWQADRVKLSDLSDTEDRQRVTLQVTGLSAFGTQGVSPVLDNFVGLPSGYAALPPLDVDVKLDVRYDKDAAELSLALHQPEALDVDYHMQLTQIGALRELVRAALAADTPAARGRSTNPRAFGTTPDMPDWTSIHLKALDVKLKDRGMVKRGIALYKRYNIALDAQGGSISSQQKQGFAQAIQTLETDCRKYPMALATQNAEQTCRALTRFLADEKDTLRVSAAPKTPVPIVQALAAFIPMLAFFGDAPPLAAQALNVEVTS